MNLQNNQVFTSAKTKNELTITDLTANSVMIESTDGTVGPHNRAAFEQAVKNGDYVAKYVKPTFTLPCGEERKYTGTREVKAFWYFKHEGLSTKNKEMYTGGFSLNMKSAAATARKNFNLYSEGGHDLVLGSIVVVEL
jgi:hypothetical protein